MILFTPAATLDGLVVKLRLLFAVDQGGLESDEAVVWGKLPPECYLAGDCWSRLKWNALQNAERMSAGARA